MTRTAHEKRQTTVAGTFTDEAFQALREMRADLAKALRETIYARGWSEAEAAAVLHVGQARITALKGDRWDQFNIETLLSLAVRIGLAPRIVVADPRGVLVLRRDAQG